MAFRRSSFAAVAALVATIILVTGTAAGKSSGAQAATTLGNGSFSHGLSGWWGYHARLTRLDESSGHSSVAHAVVRRPVKRGGILLWPRAQTTLAAGTSIKGAVSVRAPRAGATVCLRVRDVAAGEIVAVRIACTTSRGSWQLLATEPMRLQRAGDSIGFAVYLARPRIGDSVDFDGATISVAHSQLPLPEAGGPLLVGINADSQGSADPGAVQTKVTSLGIHSMREDFVRNGAGKLDVQRWDRVLADAAHRQIVILPVFTNPPDYQDTSFVAAAVARYGPGGTFWKQHPKLDSRLAPAYWEVGNEPYFKGQTAQGYARDFRAAAIAGRQANSAAKFLVAAYQDWYDSAAGRWEPWVDAMYSAVPDLNQYMAGWTIHPYDDGQDPSVWTPSTSAWNSEYQRYLKIHAVFASHGAGGVPMWITEVGWTTHGQESVSADQQAHYMAEAAQLLKGLSWARALFYYSLQDYGPRDDDREHWFGVLQVNGTPKPAYGVLRSLIQHLPAG